MRTLPPRSLNHDTSTTHQPPICQAPKIRHTQGTQTLWFSHVTSQPSSPLGFVETAKTSGRGPKVLPGRTTHNIPSNSIASTGSQRVQHNASHTSSPLSKLNHHAPYPCRAFLQIVGWEFMPTCHDLGQARSSSTPRASIRSVLTIQSVGINELTAPKD